MGKGGSRAARAGPVREEGRVRLRRGAGSIMGAAFEAGTGPSSDAGVGRLGSQGRGLGDEGGACRRNHSVLEVLGAPAGRARRSSRRPAFGARCTPRFRRRHHVDGYEFWV